MPPIKSLIYCQFCLKNKPHQLIKVPKVSTKKENNPNQNTLSLLSDYIDILLCPSYQVCQYCQKKSAKIETLPY